MAIDGLNLRTNQNKAYIRVPYKSGVGVGIPADGIFKGIGPKVPCWFRAPLKSQQFLV